MNKTSGPIPDFAHSGINLASPRLGARVIFATDEFFGAKDRLIKDEPPIFLPDEYDVNGKWMDGWETRRRRHGGNDYCVIQLGTRGTVRGVEIDTRNFTGNFPPEASVEGTLSDGPPGDDADWHIVVPRTRLEGDDRQYVRSISDAPVSHLRFQIYPDGGVARLRIFGTLVRDWSTAQPNEPVELSAITNGGYIVGYNDAHYGSPWVILTEGRGRNMGDGWETRRRRTPGNDWIVIALGAPGIVERVVVDTAHFKGNYPESCAVFAAMLGDEASSAILGESIRWVPLVDRHPLSADKIHSFEGDNVVWKGPVSHVRLNIYPDGGVSRFRIFGKLTNA